MDPLSISASIAALLSLTSTVVQYLGAVKGASKESRKVLIEVSSVSGLLYQLKDLAEREREGETLSRTVRLLGAPKGPLEQLQTALNELSSKLTPVAGWEKTRRALVWPFHMEEIKAILDKIERQKSLLGLALQQDDIELSRAIKEDVADIGKGVEELCVAQQDRYRQLVLDWLSAEDVSTNHNSARTKHQATTGDWFMQSESFSSWWNNASRSLWLHGKTILCSTIIERVRETCNNNSDYELAFFYFDFNDKAKQTIEGFVRSMIVQLSAQRSSIPDEVKTLYDRHEKSKQEPSRSSLIDTFMSLLRSSRKLYLLLDALDESSEQEDMLNLIARIIALEQQSSGISLIITSRRERLIDEVLGNLVSEVVPIQGDKVDADIELHIEQRLSKDPKLSHRPPALHEEIKEVLTKKANGMFRWVDCQLDSLGKCLTPTATKAALYSLPKSLDQTYDRILQSIPDEYRRQAQTALQWLAYSGRPLRLSELAEAVAVEPGCGWDFLDNRLFDRREILTICSSLVTVSDRVPTRSIESLLFKAVFPFEVLVEGDTRCSEVADTVPSETFNDCEIRPAHYSVKEYLASERILPWPSSFFATRGTAAQISITKTCLTYLLLFDRPNSSQWERCYENVPLLVYAAEYWHKHAQAANEEDGIDKLVVQILDDRQSFSLSNSLRNPKPAFISIARSLSPSRLQAIGYLSSSGRSLLYACEFGLLKSAARLIDGGADVHIPGQLRCSALPAAANQKHEPMAFVQLLLDAGADVNVHDQWHGTALQVAANRGRIKIVRILLSAGADVNYQGGIRGTALQAAANRGYIKIVRVLLSAGADVNVQGGILGTALQAAASRGHNETVRLLLSVGADVNIRGGFRATALRAAAYYGHNETIRLLLNAGADVKDQREYEEPMLGAVRGGDIETIRLLIDAGADVNAQGGADGNALQRAARLGRRGIFEFLLQHGAVITQAGTFDSPWDAARFGAKTVLKRW